MDRRIDGETLISEVEKRPAIWDMSLPEYSDRSARRKAWDEITYAFAGDTMDEGDLQGLGDLLQKKWKNIRDRYSREVSWRPEDGKKKVPYVYVDQLSFLKGTIKVKRPCDCTLEPSIVGRELSAAVQCLGEDQQQAPKPPAKRAKTRAAAVKAESPPDAASFLSSAVGPEVMNVEEVHTHTLLQTDENDPDRLFLLSLLTNLKSVPPQQKLNAKIDILKVFQKYELHHGATDEST